MARFVVLIFCLLVIIGVVECKALAKTYSARRGHLLGHIVKRWNEDMFGCHCSFQVQCTSDESCNQHDHNTHNHVYYSCVADCCGIRCKPKSHKRR